jgi:hypothetical protein
MSHLEHRQRIGPRTVREIRHRQANGDWRGALQLAADLARLFPEATQYVDVLSEMRAEGTIAQLHHRAKEPGRRQDARSLSKGLYELKKLRVDRPHHLGICKAIARLHVVRGETLAASGLLAEALVEAEAALTYYPDIADGMELRTGLETAMQQLRVQSAAPESEQVPLSGRQAKLRQSQAAKGFRLVDAFRRSDEARSVREDLPVAQGRLIWESIGLGPLEAVDHRALALEDAIQTVVNAQPTHAGDLPAFWGRVSQDNSHLRELDSKRVCEYLAHRLFGSAFASAPADVPPSEVAPVALRVDVPVRSSEPFVYWLFSRRNLRVKWQVLAAIALTVIAVVVGLAEFQARTIRREAYQSLREARNQASYESMIDAAEKFLSQRVIGRDDRISEVEALYSEALIRWFNEMGPSPEQAERRISRYRQLLSIRTDSVRW